MLMQLNVISVKPPLVQISPQMVNLTLVGTLGVNVVYPNKTQVTAFVLAVVSIALSMYYMSISLLYCIKFWCCCKFETNFYLFFPDKYTCSYVMYQV